MSTLCLSASLLEHYQCFLCEDLILIFAPENVSRNTVPRAAFPSTLPREQGVYSISWFLKIISLGIDPVASEYQDIHPYSGLYIDNVEINTSLIMIREWIVHPLWPQDVPRAVGPQEISWSSGLYKPIHSSSRQRAFTMSWNVLQSIRSFMPGNAWNAENRGWGKTAMLLKFGPWRSKQEGGALKTEFGCANCRKKVFTAWIGLKWQKTTL